jgi:hypothetical protein
MEKIKAINMIRQIVYFLQASAKIGQEIDYIIQFIFFCKRYLTFMFIKYYLFLIIVEFIPQAKY